jgi:hypothetical protein
MSHRNLSGSNTTNKSPSSKHRRRAKFALVTISAVAIFSGAFALSVGATSSGASIRNQDSPDLSANEAVSPLRDMMGAGGEFGSIAYAEFVNSSRASCLRDRGWNEPEPPSGYDQLETKTTVEGMRAFASSVGYGLQTHLLSNEAIDHRAAMNAQSDAIAKLDADTQGRYLTDSGSCMNEAESLGASKFPSHNSATARSMTTELTKIESLPAMQQAEKEWSACMSDRGFSYARSADARRDFSEMMFSNVSTDESVKREIETATADVECSIQTTWRVGRPLELDALIKLGLA